MAVVWIETPNSNLIDAVLPTNNGFVKIGSAIKLQNGTWVAIPLGGTNPNEIFNTQQEAANYLKQSVINKSSL